MGKLVAGDNDLVATPLRSLAAAYPELAKEADGWDPSQFTAGSNKKKPWKCKLGHQWSAVIGDRTPPKSCGCPVCSGVRVLAGYNDLKTLLPQLASEADGWDPSTLSAGSGKRVSWKCKQGHTWKASVSDRKRTGLCPFCSGRRVWKGFNDLETLYPDIASEADGWDPSQVTAGSSRKQPWICKEGHRWEATPKDRKPPSSNGCPYCSGNKVLAGFNDLESLYPDIAKQADGWDPSTITPMSNSRKPWKCSLGHRWTAVVSSRHRNGCPYCGNWKVLVGFNDLKTKCPDVAEEADGWDTTAVTPGSGKKKSWKCSLGHQWKAIVADRCPPSNNSCPYCAGRIVLPGFNDLKTLYPEVAKEADGWDPAQFTAGSNKQKRWKCEKGHTWIALIDSRTPPRSSGCPECAEKGFNPGKDAFFYLMQRPGEQQLGITNDLKQRVRQHEKNGWSLIDSVGPRSGHEVLAVERQFKQWLRSEVGRVPGTHENWFTTTMEVQSLKDLKRLSGLETDLF